MNAPGVFGHVSTTAPNGDLILRMPGGAPKSQNGYESVQQGQGAPQPTPYDLNWGRAKRRACEHRLAPASHNPRPIHETVLVVTATPVLLTRGSPWPYLPPTRMSGTNQAEGGFLLTDGDP